MDDHEAGTFAALSCPHVIFVIMSLCNAQFDIISATEPVPGDAWTDFLPESAVLKSDWKELGCGMYNAETSTCVQIESNY